jgi:hypothetical protein
VNTRVEDLAQLMGKTKAQVEEMLRSSDVIELNLSERGRGRSARQEEDSFRISL